MAGTNWVQREQAARDRERVLEALIEFIEEHGFSPIRKELAEKTGFSEITIRRHIKALIEAGLVTEEQGPRTLRPL